MTFKPINETTLTHWFTYHPATGDQLQRYSRVNAMCMDFGKLILEVCPDNADRAAALRELRRLRMDVNLAIACEEPPA